MTHAMTDRNDERWYAVWTRARHEQVVWQQLTEKRIEAFLPRVTRWSRWKDRRKRIEWPLFPGYCFARFDASHRLPVVTCNGVLNIVSFAGTPAPVPDDEVNSLRVVLEQQLACDPCPFVAEGAMVRVMFGPLRGVVGRLLRKDGARATVLLSVELISRSVRVEVDAADVVQDGAGPDAS